MVYSKFCKENEIDIAEAKKIVDKHHASKLTDADMEMIKVAVLQSAEDFIIEHDVTNASGSMEVFEREPDASVKPDWCTDWQWKCFGPRVYDREEKLRQLNGK
jgi:hypothetical protein